MNRPLTTTVTVRMFDTSLANLVLQILEQLPGVGEVLRQPPDKAGNVTTAQLIIDDANLIPVCANHCKPAEIILLHRGPLKTNGPASKATALINIGDAANRVTLRRQLQTVLGHNTEHARRVICIGASTGGLDALISILKDLSQTGHPILIVQHTSQTHFPNLIRLLQDRTGLDVRPSEPGAVLRRDVIHVASDPTADMIISPDQHDRLAHQSDPAISWHRPSIDRLFHSAAALGPRAIGVLLTGMGRDGAAGLLNMHRSGALTIVQDETTSVIYGMPRVAFEMGAANKKLPLQEISPEITRHLDRTRLASLETGGWD